MTGTDVVAVVQARMGSTRLPGKVLEPLAGATVIGLLLERLRRAETVDRIVVATTTEPADDALAEAAGASGAGVVRGPVDDVLERYLMAIQAHDPGLVVRLTGDCPLTDPELVDDAVRAVVPGVDLAHNAAPGYVRGFDVEVATAAALRRAGAEATEPHQRVHVTPWLYEHPDEVTIVELPWRGDRSDVRLTVDTAEDLLVVRTACDRVPDPVTAGWQELVAVVAADDDLRRHNADVRQKNVHEG